MPSNDYNLLMAELMYDPVVQLTGSVDVLRFGNVLATIDRTILPFHQDFVVMNAGDSINLLPAVIGESWILFNSQFITQTAATKLEWYIGAYKFMQHFNIGANGVGALNPGYSMVLGANTPLSVKNTSAVAITIMFTSYANKIRI